MQYGADESGEKARLCPSCRMEISILATKCRFCGEVVGRPKVEAHHLTIKDLGGETVSTQYAPSGNVMDAIEAFRVDEMTGSDEEGVESALNVSLEAIESDLDINPLSTSSNGSELDKDPVGVSSFPNVSKRTTTIKKKSKQQSSGNAKMIAFFIFGVVVFSLCLVYVIPAFYKAFTREATSSTPDYDNLAIGILESASEDVKAIDIFEDGGIGLKALEEAVKAVNVVNNEENRKILDMSRDRVIMEVEALLNIDPWEIKYISKASSILNDALNLDSTSELMNLKRKEVNDEEFAYRMILTEITYDSDAANRQAVFQVRTSDGNTPYAKGEGQLIAGRFKIIKIRKDKVLFEDRRRITKMGRNRKLVLSKGGNILSDS